MLDVAGHLVPVVGPSGAGKDSILRAARDILAGDARVVFPRRVVTRKAMADAEDHDSMTDMAFAHAVAKGDFALWWEAHDNSYGIPVQIDNDLAAGRTVVFNCSRTALADALERYPLVTAIEISATPAVLVERIVARGRESREEAMARVARKTGAYPATLPVIRIDNSGKLELAVNAFAAALRSLSTTIPQTLPETRFTPSLNHLTW
jgi:phosphonate metabolism protein PhnN/1,5-bisphosphokinase (PRPP-forming)